MIISSYKDLFSRFTDLKILIFFGSKSPEFDEISAFHKISNGYLNNIETYSNFFFNHTVSIEDNLRFHAIRNNLKIDFFQNETGIQKDLSFFQNKENSENLLWDLSSQGCYLMVCKYPILNRFFRMNLPKKHIETDSSCNLKNKIYEYIRDILKKRNHIYLAKTPNQISKGFDVYVLCNEYDFVGCYNDIDSIKDELEKYV